MKTNVKLIVPMLALAASCLVSNVQAQQGGGRGNFDPAAMQQRMMEMYRERLEVKDDAEWKAIEPRITKVTEAQRPIMMSRMGGMMGGMGRRGGAGGAGGAGAGGGGSDARRNFFGEPSPETVALQRAIEAKASPAELKTALEKYRASQKELQVNLEKAQADLQKVLSIQQEATAVMMGLLS